jgi:hypothetical protein
MVGLMGESGSGKSTLFQLLQRFYDPTSGSVFLDGRDIREYNPMWLREQIAVVSQDIVVFPKTLRENVVRSVCVCIQCVCAPSVCVHSVCVCTFSVRAFSVFVHLQCACIQCVCAWDEADSSICVRESWRKKSFQTFTPWTRPPGTHTDATPPSIITTNTAAFTDLWVPGGTF